MNTEFAPSYQETRETPHQKIVDGIVNGVGTILNLYSDNALTVKPEGVVRLLCRYLALILVHGVPRENLSQFQQLIIETIYENLDKGNELHVIFQKRELSKNDLRLFVKAHGEIVSHVISLVQTITTTTAKLIQHNANIVLDEQQAIQLELQLDPAFREIFDVMTNKLLTELSALNINKPLFYLLENLSVIIGWVAGFIANMNKMATKEFIERSILCFEMTIQDELERLPTIH